MELADIYERRRLRFLELVDGTRFAGSRSAAARAVDRTPSQVSQWLSGHRSISDQSRDLIEVACAFPPGWLDGMTLDADQRDARPAAAKPAPSPGSRATPPTLATALPVVLDAIAQADNVTRPAVVAALHRAIDDPSQLELTLQLLERLQAASAPPVPRAVNG